MEYKIFRDGSFAVCMSGIALKDIYPALDGKEIRPTRVDVYENEVAYTLSDGKLRLVFAHDGEDITIRTVYNGIARHNISPISAAKIEKCDRLFRQGMGIAGPSGFVKMDEDAQSHSLIAFGNEDACGVIYAREQDRFHVYCAAQCGKLSAGFDTENITIAEDALPLLRIRSGKSFSDVLTACAREIADAMHARPCYPQAFHWCSWYYLYHNLDQATLEEYLEGFQKYRDIAPFSHIQVDAGYFPSCGDWLEPFYRFPQGLEYAAQKIKEAGYEPGIWIGPFMVGDESKLFKEHPDWMLKDKEGNYIREWIQYNEPKPWGYRDSDYFVLDTSHPDAMEYLRGVFRTLRKWGYTLFKTDFLFWGLQDSAKVARHTPGKTSFEYFRDVMRMIREEIGEESRWLGCIAPFMPALGYVDMMRIAGDVGAQWDEEGFGPNNMLRELTADQYFNEIYWQNDPDAIMLRDFHIHIEREQIEALALLEAMSGGAMYTSDPIHKVGQDRRDLLEFIRPKTPHKAEYPSWGDMREEVVIRQKTATHTLVYFFNATNKPICRAVDWEKLAGGKGKYLRLWQGETKRTEEVPFVEIPKKGGLLFFVTDEPLENDPRNMWEL